MIVKTSKAKLLKFISMGLISVFLFFIVVGCGTATMHSVDISYANQWRPTHVGGVIRLDGAYMISMNKAFALMIEFCEGPYEYKEYDERDVFFTCKPNR